MHKYKANRLSIVVPVYYGATCMPELYRRLFAAAPTYFSEIELILVNDASPDDSWNEIKKLCAQDNRVKGINLSRNFGQHYAITAGLTEACGEWIVVMDCDLQDIPEEIPNLFNAAVSGGYDLIMAQRIERQDSWQKRLYSKLFYLMFSFLTDTRQDSSVANFGIYHHKVIAAILAMRDHIRYFPAMAQWVGFKRHYLPVKHAVCNRKSSYSFIKMLKLAFNSMIAFSDKPLRLVVYLGLIISLASFCLSVYYFIMHFTGKIQVMGFVSIMLSIWLLGGIIIFILGITGIYIGKIFDRVKARPLFIITDKVNGND
jgi:glycosyltransferase involved in cell wall biosynthesis